VKKTKCLKQWSHLFYSKHSTNHKQMLKVLSKTKSIQSGFK